MKTDVRAMLDQKGALAENEVKDILRWYGVPTTTYKLVKKESDLDHLGVHFPVALKVCSRKILHKTDVGGVKLGIQNEEQLRKEYAVLRKRFPSEDLLVDQMAVKGVEAIIGLVQDPTFGLSIMAGVGGIFTELYKDVTFRVVPINHDDAEQMIEEIKGKKLFEGFRGSKAGKGPMIDVLLKVSAIGEELSQRIDQMDLNPVFVYEHDVCVVDAKLILK